MIQARIFTRCSFHNKYIPIVTGKNVYLQLHSCKHMSTINLTNLRILKRNDIEKLVEVIERTKFINEIKHRVSVNNTAPMNHLVYNAYALTRFKESNISHDAMKIALESSIATFMLHVEARIASNLGVGKLIFMVK